MRKSLIWINLIIAMGALGFTNVVNAKDEYPLHMAAANDDIQLIKHILSQKTLIDARDETGSTALMVATRANNIHAAHMLIEAGADVNAKDNIQDSPYLYAGAQGYLKIFSVHDKFHRTLILSGFCLLKIAKISLNSSFFPKPIKR